MMVMRRSQFSSTMPKTKVAETPPRLKPTIFLSTLITLSTLLIAGNASASDNLQLVPDFGLFNWFGESYFGDLWIMIIGFVLLVFPLNQLIFQPIFRSLDDRAEKINGARNRSVDLQKQADDVLDRYEIAIREARGESEQTRQAGLIRAREEQATLTAEARGEAERELVNARAELGRSLEDARASLRSNAEELAGAAAEQVLGRTLS
jgi:F-type H+-transporting ATPase subunit b